MSEFIVDSPFLESLGARLTVWRAGYAEFSMPIHAGNLNRQGVLQGGAIATLLVGVKATDPVTYVAMAMAFGGIAVLACGIPASRAARFDPLVALRQD